jgi:hypothetical protein
MDADDGPQEGLYTTVVADSHHFDEEQDPDPHYSEKLDPDPGIEIKSWTRIRIYVIRIRIPDYFIISTTDVFLEDICSVCSVWDTQIIFFAKVSLVLSCKGR